MYRRSMCVALVCALGVASTACGNLIGWWTFDEGTGTVAADSSGNGSNGTFVGAPVWVTGMLDGALEFNGSSCVDCGNAVKLSTTGPITVACWVKPTVLSEDKALVAWDAGYTFKCYGTSLRFTTPGILDHTATNTVLETGVWQHVAVTFQPSTTNGAIFYLNGGETCRLNSSAVAAGTGPFRIANNQWNQWYTGAIDDVRVFNHILSGGEILAAMAGEVYPFASVTAPQDGAMVASQQVTLTWKASELATSHNVYFGDDKNAVAAATETDTAIFLGNTTATSLALATSAAGLLTPGKTYYWRIDEVNPDNPDSPWKGAVWSFSVQPLVAWSPTPADGISYVDPDQDLSWQTGTGALFHTVYFGQSFDEVDTATVGATMTTSTTYDPGQLAADTTYYWRVDEFLPSGTQKGAVWSFRTRPAITEVADPNLLAWWKLDEGEGLGVTDWSGHGYHGALAGGATWTGGFRGAALQLDGVDDCATFGAPAALFLPRNYTYSLWFRVAKNIYGNSGAQYLLCFGSRSDLILGVEDGVGVNGDLSLHYYDTTPGFGAISAGNIIWDSDEWHMAVATKDSAVGHKLYLDGELKAEDTNTKNDNYDTTRIISIGARAWTNPRVAFFKGTIDEVRVYNKALTADQIDDLLRGDTLMAQDPSPSQGAIVDIRDAVELSWTAGDGAASHDVYFGTDRKAVAAADKTSPEFQGNQAGASLDLDGLVQLGGAYYWRIDEVQADGSAYAGDVWGFTVPAYLIVDDFESYTNDQDNGQAIWQTWIDGVENGTTSYVGYETAVAGTFGETTFVHGGGQSMPMDYNNVNSPYYAEAVRTFDSAQDWTAAGVDTLTLFVRGRIYNGQGPFYVALEDSSGKLAVVYDDEAVNSPQWMQLDIPLSEFANVNAAKIKKMYIGAGEREATTAGGAGRIFVDDIWVTKQ
ncbi:MAG: LamG domain-containing protein [Phycisphaerae bacterium]|nr:LamG domain-containing protein [Phycisphaerae bacterium]